ncbi:MAG: type II toxin-antitoxin system VapC family toxin [Candidatus Bathyarchaeia archaeon]
MRRWRVRRGEYSRRIYVDVNVLYYYLTAHPVYGEISKRYLEEYGGQLVTSSLTAWLLYVLTRVENVASILDEIGVELAPFDSSLLKEAARLKKPKDFEDRIHLATALRLGVATILSNDRDFDGIPGIRRIFE